MSGLIYIVGSGRSGSTVVERVLNTSRDVAAVGEIHALWRLPLDTLRCSCGSPVPDCAFWADVFAAAGIERRELDRLADLERAVVRNRYMLKLGFDPGRIRRDDRLADFIAVQARLFQGIRSVSGCQIVLDSSKAGPRAWVLAAGLDPVFLHTYRAAEDVISSWRRPKHDPSTGRPMTKPTIARAAIDWIKAEQSARRLARLARVRRVDHSAFAIEPRQVLCAALDADFPGLVDALDWTGPASVRGAAQYHSVLGNPDRFGDGEIHIQPPSPSGRAPLPGMERMVIKALGRTLSRVFR